MADEIDLFETFGGPPKKQSGQQETRQTAQEDDSGVDLSMFGNKPGSVAGQKENNEKSTTDPYEQKVRGLGPRAAEEIKKGGYKRAAEASSVGAPIIGPVVGAVARGTQAAYEAATGNGSIGENYERLAAEDEALRRAANEQYPKTSIASEIGGSLALPVGEIAAPFVAGSKLMGPVGSLAMKGLGYGAEAGVYGAGSAAAEQAIGTQSKENQPGILESTVTGAELGAGLGIGGTLLGRAYNKTLSPMLGAIAPESVSKALGFRTPQQSVRNLLIDEAVKASSAGGDHAPSRKTIDYILDQEAKAGIPLEKSIVNNLDLFPANSHKAILGEYSTNNGKIQQEFERIFNSAKERASTLGSKADLLLDDMHNESALNALNAQRDARGITEHITEPPSAEELRSIADEVRKGAWEREVQPIYDAHQSVNSSTLSTMLPLIDNRIVEKAQNDMNVLRQTRGQQPFNFLTQDANGKWQTQGFGAMSYSTPFYQNLAKKAGQSDGVPNGAPLEFWDMLAGQMQGSVNKADQAIGQQIREGVDQYFSGRGAANELKAAKDSFRGIRGEGNAITAGMNFIRDGGYQTNAAKRSTFLKRWDKMSDTEKGLYQAGVLQQIYATIRQGEKGFADWQRILKDDQNRKILESVMNFRPTTAGQLPQGALNNYEKLQATMEIGKYAKMQSQMDNLAQTPKSKAYYSRFGIPSDIPLPESMLVAAERASYFGPTALAAYALRGVYGYARQLFKDAKARQYLQIMSEQDPVKIRQLADEVARAKSMGPSWKKYQNYIEALNEANEKNYRKIVRFASSPTYQTGGRIGYGPGGEVDGPEDQAPTDLDENNMYSPTGRAVRGLHPSIGNQKMPVAQALSTILGKGGHKYEMGHAGIIDPFESTVVPGKRLEGMTHATPYELGELVEKHSPVPKMLPHLESDAGKAAGAREQMYEQETGNRGAIGDLDYEKWALSNEGRKDFPRVTQYDKFRGHTHQGGHSYFELPISVNPSSVKEPPFIPSKDDLTVVRYPQKGGAAVKDATGLKVFSYPGDQVPSDQFLKEAAYGVLRDQATEASERNQKYSAGHFGGTPNTVLHVRGQTVTGSDDNPNAPILNVDEIQSDVNKQVRRAKENPMQKGYDPSRHRKAYQEAKDAEVDAKDAASKFNDLRKQTDKAYADLQTAMTNRAKSPMSFFGSSSNIDQLRKKYEGLSDTLRNLKTEVFFKDDVSFSKTMALQDIFLSSKDSIPHLAFGDDEARYTRLANKSVLQKAIDEGHEAITWTPWQEQIIRNNHALPVHRLMWQKHPTEGIFLLPRDSRGRKIDMLRDHSRLSDPNHGDAMFPNQLDNVLGPRVAGILREKLKTGESGVLDHIPMFVAPNDARKALAAEKTYQYYAKTAPRDMETYLRSMDPSAKHDPNFRSFESGHVSESFPQPGISISDAVRNHVKKKGQPRFKDGGEVDGIDAPSILESQPPIEIPRSLKELQDWQKTHSKQSRPSMDDVFTARMSGFEGAAPISMPANLAELQAYTRTKRATGGRIPEVDKLFKAAKRTLDGETKPMLNMHDDDIVRALRVAQGRI